MVNRISSLSREARSVAYDQVSFREHSQVPGTDKRIERVASSTVAGNGSSQTLQSHHRPRMARLQLLFLAVDQNPDSTVPPSAILTRTEASAHAEGLMNIIYPFDSFVFGLRHICELHQGQRSEGGEVVVEGVISVVADLSMAAMALA